MAQVGQKQQRTLRKFGYRGADLNQLLDTSCGQLVQLYRVAWRWQRQRQRLTLGLRWGQHLLLKCMRDKRGGPAHGEAEVGKTHLWDSIVLLETVGVY